MAGNGRASHPWKGDAPEAEATARASGLIAEGSESLTTEAPLSAEIAAEQQDHFAAHKLARVSGQRLWDEIWMKAGAHDLVCGSTRGADVRRRSIVGFPRGGLLSRNVTRIIPHFLCDLYTTVVDFS